jgi:hypothetical protein
MVRELRILLASLSCRAANANLQRQGHFDPVPAPAYLHEQGMCPCVCNGSIPTPHAFQSVPWLVLASSLVLLPTVTGAWFVALRLHCESVVTCSWRRQPNLSGKNRNCTSPPLISVQTEAGEVCCRVTWHLPYSPCCHVKQCLHVLHLG